MPHPEPERRPPPRRGLSSSIEVYANGDQFGAHHPNDERVQASVQACSRELTLSRTGTRR